MPADFLQESQQIVDLAVKFFSTAGIGVDNFAGLRIPCLQQMGFVANTRRVLRTQIGFVYSPRDTVADDTATPPNGSHLRHYGAPEPRSSAAVSYKIGSELRCA